MCKIEVINGEDDGWEVMWWRAKGIAESRNLFMRGQLLKARSTITRPESTSGALSGGWHKSKCCSSPMDSIRYGYEVIGITQQRAYEHVHVRELHM